MKFHWPAGAAAAMAVNGSGVFVAGENDIPPFGQDQPEFGTVAFQP